MDRSAKTGAAKRLYVALANGDREALAQLLHPDFTGVATAGLPLGLGGSYDSPEAMQREFWWRIGRTWAAARYAGSATAVPTIASMARRSSLSCDNCCAMARASSASCVVSRRTPRVDSPSCTLAPWRCAIERTMAKWGRIDVLIANAGILRDKSFSKMLKDCLNTEKPAAHK